MKGLHIIAIMMCFFVVFIFVFSLRASVQGTIKGVVTDINGNPIDGIKISITSMSYATVRYTLKSDKKGEFIQIGLQPDYYQISAEKDGFLPVVFERRVAISQHVDASFEMEEGKYYAGDPPGEKDFKKGNEWFSKGMYQEASESYQRAIGKEPDEPVYYNNLGISYTKLERYDEAIDAYKRMLEVQPSSYTANKSLGELYGMQKEYPDAMPYFVKAAELSPDDPDAFYDLGACLMNTGSRGEAVNAFAKAIEIKADHAMAHYQLGMIYVNQNNKEEAIKHLEQFLELSPGDPNAPVARKIIEYLK